MKKKDQKRKNKINETNSFKENGNFSSNPCFIEELLSDARKNCKSNTSSVTKYKTTSNETENDQADSIDSGCVPDGSIDTPTARYINWDQVKESVNMGYNFAIKLLQHTQEEGDNEGENTNETFPVDEEKLKNFIPKANGNIEKKSDAETIKILTETLGKLNRGKLGNLSRVEADRLKSKLKKKIIILEHQRKKEGVKAEKTSQRNGTTNSEAYPGIPSRVASAKKIYNQSGKLVFSKFDFSGTSKDMWTEKKKPDLKHALSKVLKEKEKIKSLTEAGQFDDAVKRIDNKAWNHANKRINGEKVKDDYDRINNSLKKKKHEKFKSKQKWSERSKMVQKSKESKQDKRKQNIQSRKQKNYETKVKKLKKKGRMAPPGF